MLSRRLGTPMKLREKHQKNRPYDNTRPPVLGQSATKYWSNIGHVGLSDTKFGYYHVFPSIHLQKIYSTIFLNSHVSSTNTSFGI